MSDSSAPSAPPPPGGNLPELTVSELAGALKRVVEGNFERVRVRGEISGFKRAASGHLYMALKDENAVLDAVCWRGVAGKLSVAPEDGLEVVASGRLTTYPARSRYQIVIDQIELAGEGALLKLLEERRRKLAAEGIFDAGRKRPLPYLPQAIGVVTSPTGAVIRDILHRLADRFPRRVLVWPVLVQGEGAAGQVAAAIRGFNALAEDGPLPRPDLLIVARGGGSLEDLWAFNEEVVVRAAAGSEIPLISAVGHETDTTLIDFASDRRAPTPTAAAEIAVPVRAEILADVMDYARRMVAAGGRLIEERRVRVEGLARGLPDPRRMVEEKAQRLDDRAERLGNAVNRVLERKQARLQELFARVPRPRHALDLSSQRLGAETRRLAALGPRLTERPRQSLDRLDAARRLNRAWQAFVKDRRSMLGSLGRVLESTSYVNVLKRGFAVVHGPEGLVTRAAAMTPGAALELEFADGKAPAVAGPGGASASGTVKPAPKPRRKPKPDDEPQGSLL